jgi:hypothetical protein
MSEQVKLVMEFDPNTIEHLGIQMYSTLPPVIAELVANSYDAEAEEVKIFLYDNSETKRIIIKDNGHGMSFGEINARFLRIGKNRRKNETNQSITIQKSDNGKRDVIGRKGLGKLSFFGIAEEVKITTIKNGLKTVFKMDIDKIRKSMDTSYEPEVIEKESTTKELNGTSIELLKIARKTSYIPEKLALSLSRGFEIFDQNAFNVVIIHNDKTDEIITVSNSLKYETLKTELEWDFPNTDFEFSYGFASKVSGRIISVKQGETVPSEMRGIALFSRKKLVNKHDFYDSIASSTGYAYLTGWLSVDFIEDFPRDVISTNRQSLNWELEETEELKDFLQQTIKKVYNEQRDYRKTEKLKELKNKLGFDLETWLNQIQSTSEKKLARKLLNSIVENEEIDAEKGGELIGFIKDSFQFEAFKELARDIDAADIQQTDKIISLFKEWRIIEAREFQKIAKIRIETIKKFEEYIKLNAREVPTLHNFLKEFPWILDPKIMNFKDEVFYSTLLREKYPEDNIELEENKRIDFLCVNFAQTYFIIELKRPNSVISHKELDQCLEYISFLEARIGNENRQKVCCYLVGGKIAESDTVRKKLDSFRFSNDVYFKTYGELLGQAESYHQEFIDRYDEINQNG